MSLKLLTCHYVHWKGYLNLNATPLIFFKEMPLNFVNVPMMKISTTRRISWNNSAHFIRDQATEEVKAWEAEFIRVLKELDSSGSGRDWEFFMEAAGSFNVVAEEAIMNDAVMLGVGYSIVFLYVALCLGKRDLVGFRVRFLSLDAFQDFH